jgi:hypothetical protein
MVEDSNVPDIVWIKGDASAAPKGCGFMLVAAALVALMVIAGDAGSGEPKLEFGRGFWTAVTTNPLAWLMAAGCYYLLGRGLQAWARPECLQWRCPHCSDLNTKCSDQLIKAPLGHIFRCSACKNDFRKTAMPH